MLAERIHHDAAEAGVRRSDCTTQAETDGQAYGVVIRELHGDEQLSPSPSVTVNLESVPDHPHPNSSPSPSVTAQVVSIPIPIAVHTRPSPSLSEFRSTRCIIFVAYIFIVEGCQILLNYKPLFLTI